MDARRVEKFILFDYIEPDLLWISSIWKVTLFRGLRRSLLIAFVWSIALFILMLSDVDVGLNLFISLAVLPIPIVAVASVVYHRRIIIKDCEKIYAKHKNKLSNEARNQRIGSAIIMFVSVTLLSFARFVPEMFSAIMPLLSLVSVIAAGGLGFVIMFQICGQLYKIYLIKKHCPYLKTPADARHYIADDETNNHITR